MLWDLNESKHLYSLDAGNEIHSLVFSPNRYWLCAASGSVIKIFDLETKLVVEELKVDFIGVGKKSQEPQVTCLAWSADGQTLFSGYTDGLIRVSFSASLSEEASLMFSRFGVSCKPRSAECRKTKSISSSISRTIYLSRLSLLPCFSFVSYFSPPPLFYVFFPTSGRGPAKARSAILEHLNLLWGEGEVEAVEGLPQPWLARDAEDWGDDPGPCSRRWRPGP